MTEGEATTLSGPSDVPIILEALEASEAGSSASQVYRNRLRQGYAPRRQLRESGFKPLTLLEARLGAEGVTVTFEVVRMHAAHHRPSGTARAPEPVDVVRQRLAAYAVVTSERGVLLTQLSARTGRPGLWILPGGGVDAGEAPDAAVAREVWEEAGQHVEEPRLLDISSSHRVGEGREGLIEDFHAVRLVYTATCRQPSDPVVHDVGGSTQSARWFDVADAADPSSSGYPRGGIAPWALEALRQAADRS